MTPNLPVYTDRDMLEHQQRRFARMSVHQPMDLGAQNNHENVPTNYGSSAAINRYPYAGAPGGGYFSVPFDSYKYMNGSQMFQQLSLQLSPHSGSQSSRQSCSQLSPESNSQLSPNEQNNSELQADKSDDFDNDNNQDESDKNINNKRKRKTNEKTKSYSCKRCDYVALSKLDFWKHNAIHIRPERRLECPKCPFVTELKHHLRFHMDNHNGAKPFRCEACNYSCVNKSMLKSHEKLHLDILQYRCADCTFAAKYYHSLKKHLKKLHHKAQVILNRDGTPNPLTIIDTYGTRRGPKQKPVQKKSTDDKQNDNQNIEKQIDKSFDNETFLNIDNNFITNEEYAEKQIEEFNDNNEMPNKTPKLSNEIISVPDNNKKINITDNNINNESTKKKFTCNYCEISFVKEVMYSLHMGFHGFNDPFHCNSCGKKYEDDVSFFLHICRSEHA
ncbi:protein hunchback [Aphidius gifuensis]|uniref:protein hunchback n=1 Tax=Aphidius gifuensis TaxID=684658 RepID=UPI001CDCAE12|nr:protein hunchback [Aphidius gifuensis]